MTKSQRMRLNAVMISSTMPSAKYSCSGSPDMFWNGKTAMDGLSGSGSAASAPTRAADAAPPSPACGGGLLPAAEVTPSPASGGGLGWGLCGRDARAPVPSPTRYTRSGRAMFLRLCSPRSSKAQSSRSCTWSCTMAETQMPARFGHGFEPCGDVDAVAVDVVAVDDHIAEIDPDPEFDALGRRDARAPFAHRFLHLGRAAHRVDDAAELDQHAVAGSLDDAAIVLGDTRIDKLGPQRLESRQGAFLVRPHQPRVAGDIGGQDRGEAAGCGHLINLDEAAACRHRRWPPRFNGPGRRRGMSGDRRRRGTLA